MVDLSGFSGLDSLLSLKLFACIGGGYTGGGLCDLAAEGEK